MTGLEAEKIVNNYGSTLARGTDGSSVVRRASWLLDSKPRIKQAYFIYLEAVYEQKNHLLNDFKEKMIVSYNMLNSFIEDDEADRLIMINKMWQDKKLNPDKDLEDKELVDEYLQYLAKMRDESLAKEIYEFIDELTTK